MTLTGNTANIRKDLLKQLENLAEIDTPRHQLINPELAEKLAYYTGQIQREIAVIIDRKGHIRNISIGDDSTDVYKRQHSFLGFPFTGFMNTTFSPRFILFESLF